MFCTVWESSSTGIPQLLDFIGPLEVNRLGSLAVWGVGLLEVAVGESVCWTALEVARRYVFGQLFLFLGSINMSCPMHVHALNCACSPSRVAVL